MAALDASINRWGVEVVLSGVQSLPHFGCAIPHRALHPASATTTHCLYASKSNLSAPSRYADMLGVDIELCYLTAFWTTSLMAGDSQQNPPSSSHCHPPLTAHGSAAHNATCYANILQAGPQKGIRGGHGDIATCCCYRSRGPLCTLVPSTGQPLWHRGMLEGVVG